MKTFRVLLVLTIISATVSGTLVFIDKEQRERKEKQLNTTTKKVYKKSGNPTAPAT